MAQDLLMKRIKAVFRVTSGHFLEMFDFILFGFYATYIARTFFPSESDYASLMLTLLTFGAGFLMRPLGAVILGAMSIRRPPQRFDPHAVADGRRDLDHRVYARLRHDRRPGAAADPDRPAVAGFLGRRGTRKRRGVSRGDGAQGPERILRIVAVSRATDRRDAGGAARLRHEQMARPAQIADWGWRIPFAIGCTLVPFLFVIRRSLEETEEFLARKHRPPLGEIFVSLWANIGIVLAGVLMVAMTTVSFYLLTVYTPTFGIRVLHLSASDSLLVALAVGLVTRFGCRSRAHCPIASVAGPC